MLRRSESSFFLVCQKYFTEGFFCKAFQASNQTDGGETDRSTNKRTDRLTNRPVHLEINVCYNTGLERCTHIKSHV